MELNHRHEDFQSSALPTELPGLVVTGIGARRYGLLVSLVAILTVTDQFSLMAAGKYDPLCRALIDYARYPFDIIVEKMTRLTSLSFHGTITDSLIDTPDVSFAIEFHQQTLHETA